MLLKAEMRISSSARTSLRANKAWRQAVSGRRWAQRHVIAVCAAFPPQLLGMLMRRSVLALVLAFADIRRQ
jgi:hypothetical protein